MATMSMRRDRDKMGLAVAAAVILAAWLVFYGWMLHGTVAQQPVPATSAAVSSSSLSSAACRQFHEPKGSELCAQWRSSIAAEESAFWAKWSFWAAGAGLLGLLSTLYYTRKAVQAAEDAATDAVDALEIARSNADAAQMQVAVSQDTARRQLRPYVSLSATNVTLNSFGSPPAVSLQICNRGQTPAYDLQTTGVLRFSESDVKAVGEFLWDPVPLSLLGPDVTAEINIAVDDGEQHYGFPLFCIAEARYSDGFNRRYSSRFVLLFENTKKSTPYGPGCYEVEISA